MLKQLSTGEEYEIREKAFILTLPDQRKVLSNSIFHGGIHHDIKNIYNFDLKDEKGYCQLKEETYEKELVAIAKSLGLDAKATTGMTTAVGMEDNVIVEKSRYGLNVTAISTAGIENNGGCVGDPCSYREENENFILHPGTINTILIVNANLPDGILLRSAVTATEGKCQAIRELQLPSLYSEEIASGSGTDGLMIVTNPNAPLTLTDAGKHSLLGELIGCAVKESVKEALLKHMKKSDTDMNRMSNRLKRFGITLEGFSAYGKDKALKPLETCWKQRNMDSSVAVKAMLFASLLDNFRWQLINEETFFTEIRNLLTLEESKDKDPIHYWYEYLLKKTI